MRALAVVVMILFCSLFASQVQAQSVGVQRQRQVVISVPDPETGEAFTMIEEIEHFRVFRVSGGVLEIEYTLNGTTGNSRTTRYKVNAPYVIREVETRRWSGYGR